ncbi:hypothetical protein R1flu_002939 [Riccia fluitans]|uniref:Uncharacterized protein n=1 Tax=Riccia fluitans TaxID=41844 RepID=A0ABD1Y8I3_9MARC
MSTHSLPNNSSFTHPLYTSSVSEGQRSLLSFRPCFIRCLLGWLVALPVDLCAGVRGRAGLSWAGQPLDPALLPSSASRARQTVSSRLAAEAPMLCRSSHFLPVMKWDEVPDGSRFTAVIGRDCQCRTSLLSFTAARALEDLSRCPSAA